MMTLTTVVIMRYAGRVHRAPRCPRLLRERARRDRRSRRTRDARRLGVEHRPRRVPHVGCPARGSDLRPRARWWVPSATWS